MQAVTPLSLGVQILGDVMRVVIPRRTAIPAKKKHDLITITDDQTSMTIVVYEGERSRASSNHLVGRFEVTGIPPAPVGEAKIEVWFDIDEDGILKVSAEEKGSGRKNEITIFSRLSAKEEIKRMVRVAEQFRWEDKMHLQKADAMNALWDYAYEMRIKIRDENIAARKKKKIEAAIISTFEWLSSDEVAVAEVDEFETEMKKLQHIRLERHVHWALPISNCDS